MNEAERCNDDAFTEAFEGKKNNIEERCMGNTRITTSNIVLHVYETSECSTSE